METQVEAEYPNSRRSFTGDGPTNDNDNPLSTALNKLQHVNDDHTQRIRTVCGDASSCGPGTHHLQLVEARCVRQGKLLSIPMWPGATTEQQPMAESLNDESMDHRHLYLACDQMPSFTTPSETEDSSIGADALETTSTRSLRKGIKAHRRAATMSALSMLESEIAIFTELEPQRPMQSEFGIRLRIHERMNFDSDPPARTNLRGMRDSVLGRITNITSRRNAGLRGKLRP